MNLILLFFVAASGDKVVEVHDTEIAPKIDGVIENIWQDADSVYDFVQFEPYEKAEPNERTVVFVLQDKENLYFAFRCYAQKHKPTACLTEDEDDVRIGIDPFNSKNTAYYFQVFGSGLFYDGWILDDGRTYDNSWEGVWYHAVKIYDDRFEVEIKIPFKSIRYKKGLDQWGIGFGRYIAASRETDCWNEYFQFEGVLVSKFGALKGIRPQITGYYFELYPEGYVRYDQYHGEDDKIKPRASLNFKWDLTPQTTLNATAYPDFAQIESDPFTLNLSRYPTYLEERRPFFLEGQEIFRMSNFGEDMDFFEPINIFYSRRIGKSMNGDAVPIITGVKLTNKSEYWNLGVMSAYTDEYSVNDTVLQPRRGFGVLRTKHRVFKNSELGMLFSGAMAGKDNYDYALGLDGVWRKGVTQLIAQGVVSDKNTKRGWAVASGFCDLIGNFYTFVSGSVVSDSFDVSDIGFVPWPGQKQFLLMSGPYKNFPEGFIRDLYIAPGLSLDQEPGNINWSKVGMLEINPNFRNNWGLDFMVRGGPYYEADTNYLFRSFHLIVWGNLYGQILNGGVDYSYSYNYRRGYLANQGANWLTYNYSIIPQLSMGLNSNLWIEWDTHNAIVAMTPRVRPQVTVRFDAYVNLSIFSELVMEAPGTDLGATDLLSNRIGMLFSWNFKPKSWLYLAVNDYRERDVTGSLQPQYTISAIKVKYLIYF